jgi:hypothetical protein
MNKKTIYLVVAVVVVILVVGVAGVMLLGGNNGTTNPTATPTAAPSATVSEATSIQFSVTETTTASGDVVNYEFACKDLNTANEKMRIDMDLGSSGAFIYIVDTGAQKSWLSMDDGATWTESVFADDCTAYGTLLHNFVDKLVAESNTGADLSYTTDTASIAISCIAVNPTLEDSLFTAS